MSVAFTERQELTQNTFTHAVAAEWIATGDGTGRYTVNDPHAAVYAGFSSTAPINLGTLHIEKLDTPFASILLAPADPTKTLANADRLLLTAVARVENTGMVRSPDRKTVGTQWGKSPARIEVVHGEISLPGVYRAFAITPDGTRGNAIPTTTVNGRCVIPLGSTDTLWYELIPSR
jgi:hypothetical protein